MSKCCIANISKEELNEFEFDYSYLKKEDLETEMKDLVLESNDIESRLPISFSFVYMFDYEEEQMQKITKYFKERNILNVIYCGSTRKNLLWTLRELLDEIINEHQTFYKNNELKDLIKKVMQLPKNKNQADIEKALMKAFVILQNNNLNQMKDMIAELEELIKNNMENRKND